MSVLKFRRLVRGLAIAAALLGGITLTPAAFASMMVLEQSALVSGTQSSATAFTVPGAGTLRVTLTDLNWPERLATLSFALSDASSVLGRLTAPGVQQFQMTGAAQLFAHVFTVGSGALDTGLYSVRVDFTPVPIPSAAVLLLAGMGLFAAMRRPNLRQLLPVTG